jgi:enamine deaminase RidA (YjgF/YER057c/UK114 family)
MARIEEKLKAMGVTLPPAFKFAKPNRRGCMAVGKILYCSGHGPAPLPGIITKGKLGGQVTLEEGNAAARATAIHILAAMKEHLGDLDKVERIVSVFGMVNAVPTFTQPSQVIDGFSDFVYELWGPENGWHTRCAVGMATLPGDQPVEIKTEWLLK